ncbi:MAG TPA: hypothetical protein P5572_02865 [Phycisphaerae bacterium]|nr:hypothetical protein [Phycisphaerae bacterium]
MTTDEEPILLDGVVHSDCDCIHCGYNVRGQPTAGNCPECGAAVADSTRSTLLANADPAWLAGVVRGLAIIMWMIVIPEVIGFVLGLLRALTIMWPLGIGYNAVRLYGFWLITRPDPHGIGTRENRTARRIVLGSLAAIIGSYCLLLFIPVILGNSTVASAFVGVSISSVHLCGIYFQFHYFGWFGQRIPNHKLVRRAAQLKWLALLTLGVEVLVNLSVALIAAVSWPAIWSSVFVSLYYRATTLVNGVVWLLVFVLLFVLRRSVKRSLRRSRMTARLAVQ